MQTIEIAQTPEKIILSSPYDEKLVEEIKYIPSGDRAWSPQKKVWLIENSPKLLDYCRYICYNCAKRRDWLFVDLDFYSQDELLLNRLELHFKLAKEAIASVQSRELVLLKVEGHFIHLCFNKKVSNDTFWAVKNAAFDEYYQGHRGNEMSHHVRNRFLFIYTNEIIKLLVEKQCLNLKYKDYKKVYKNLNIGIIHLVDLESKSVWIGKSSNDAIALDKDFTLVDEIPFQLYSLMELFQGLFKSINTISEFKAFLFDNQLERSSILEYLFYNLPLEVKCRRINGSKKLEDYYCDLDPLLDFFAEKEGERELLEIYPLFGIYPTLISQIIRQVKATKESLWIQHVKPLKESAIDDFNSKFYDIFTKEGIIQTLINYKIDYRKSWRKDKLWQALINSPQAQSLAERYLSLPQLPPHPTQYDAVLGGLNLEPSPQSTDAVLGSLDPQTQNLY